MTTSWDVIDVLPPTDIPNTQSSKSRPRVKAAIACLTMVVSMGLSTPVGSTFITSTAETSDDIVVVQTLPLAARHVRLHRQREQALPDFEVARTAQQLAAEFQGLFVPDDDDDPDVNFSMA